MNEAEVLSFQDVEPASGVLPIGRQRAGMGDVEALIDAIEDARATDFDAWRHGVEAAAEGLFDGGGRAHVQVVAGCAPRRVDDSKHTLRVAGQIGAATSVVLSIERASAARLRASERSRLKRVALHLENRARFHTGGRWSPLATDVVSPALWLDLVHGRASLLRDAAGDSYRVLTAPPSWVRHRAFNSTQAQVVALATSGALYKSIAQDLGLSSAAVSHALGMAAAKIGARKPVELLRIAYALNRADADAGADADADAARAGALTDAEREVLALVVEGMSNQDIARARNRSLRTVANQVSSLLRKLRCASRYQLAASRRAR